VSFFFSSFLIFGELERDVEREEAVDDLDDVDGDLDCRDDFDFDL
jgi:hypothetical protein